jgi:hypothetical protein
VVGCSAGVQYNVGVVSENNSKTFAIVLIPPPAASPRTKIRPKSQTAILESGMSMEPRKWKHLAERETKQTMARVDPSM